MLGLYLFAKLCGLCMKILIYGVAIVVGTAVAIVLGTMYLVIVGLNFILERRTART